MATTEKPKSPQWDHRELPAARAAFQGCRTKPDGFDFFTEPALLPKSRYFCYLDGITMRRLRITLGVALIFSTAHPSFAKPSFDCKKASKPDEIAICNDEKLANLETVYAILYKYSVGLMGKKSAMFGAQELMKGRRACKGDRACLETAFESNIKSTKAAIDGQYEYLDLKP